MTIEQALSRARKILVANNVEDAPLESELLLRHVLKISRVQLYLELERELGPQEEQAFWPLIKRRLNHEPTAYITGCREFYGLDFYVDPSVLIPRPESELLVEKAIKPAYNHAVSTIAEVGTGCGAIAISLSLSLPQAKIYAIDISASALKVALSNCQKHGVTDRICLLLGDMLDPLLEPVDLVVANLPYYIVSPVLRHFLEAVVKPEMMVVMVQKEVAKAIVAEPGQMSLLSISVQFYGKPAIVSYVPASCFYPAPKVDSAILKIGLYPQPAVAVADRKGFFALVRAGFSASRKQIVNSLAQGLGSTGAGGGLRW